MNSKEQQRIKGQRERRVRRVRAKITGTSERPRLAVFRSLRSFSAQLIDDQSGKTLLSVSQKEFKAKKGAKPVEIAAELGKLLGEKAGKAGIKSIVFDRRHYQYHGRVKAFADAVREAGLTF